ncbi:MAG: acyl-CoA dehydrogenase family protein, partial [Mycolicibacterium sp.]
MATDITDRIPDTLLRTPADALAAAEEVAEAIAAGSAERERAGAVLTPQLRLVAESGLLGISVPTAHGGPGLPAS